MLDKDIRPVLRRAIRARFDNVRWVEELGIANQVRADFTTIGKDTMIGYEIKSDGDTLKRLPEQVKYYSKICDQAAVVVTRKHLEAASKVVPEWWGVLLVEGDEIVSQRELSANPCKDPMTLASLLWKSEAIATLDQLGCARGVRSKNRRIVWSRLVSVTDTEQLSSIVRKQLATRFGWRNGLESPLPEAHEW